MDAWRLAEDLVAQHGDKAIDFAAEKYRELSEDGDPEILAAWTEVIEAVRAFTAFHKKAR